MFKKIVGMTAGRPSISTVKKFQAKIQVRSWWSFCQVMPLEKSKLEKTSQKTSIDRKGLVVQTFRYDDKSFTYI